MKSRFSLRFAVTGLAATAIGVASLVAGVPAATAAGQLTLTPASGTGDTGLSVATSAGCNDPNSTHFDVLLKGAGVKQVASQAADDSLTFVSVAFMVGLTPLSAIGATGSGTASMTTDLSQVLLQVASTNKDGVLPTGSYSLTFECRGAFGGLSTTFSTPLTIRTDGTGVLSFSQGAGPALTNVTAPTVTGNGKVGKVLKVSKGTWAATPTSVTYEWKSGKKVVSTLASYKPVASDKGKKLSIKITATAPGYSPGTVTVQSPTIS